MKGDKYVTVVKQPVHDALVSFCAQSEEFAQAVEQSDKSLSDCLATVVKGVGSTLSDIEAYRRAAEFYFPGCEVEMKLSIHMSKYEADEPKKAQEEKAINLSLIDLL